MFYPNFYTDDEWNDLDDDDRLRSSSMGLPDREECEQRLEELEAEIRSFGAITGSDDYNDYQMLGRQVDFYQSRLSEIEYDETEK